MAILPSLVVAAALACCTDTAPEHASVDYSKIADIINSGCQKTDINSLCDILSQMGIHIDDICNTGTNTGQGKEDKPELAPTMTPAPVQTPQTVVTPKPVQEPAPKPTASPTKKPVPAVTASPKPAPQATAVPKPTVKPTQTPSSGTESTEEDRYAAEVVELVNKEREKYGLGKLSVDTALMRASYQRAKEIKSSFSHTRPDGTSCFTVLYEYGISYRHAGENIAYGQRTPQAVVTAWLNSEGHRANILNGNFTKIGVGCYKSGGTYYWSQEFTG